MHLLKHSHVLTWIEMLLKCYIHAYAYVRWLTCNQVVLHNMALIHFLFKTSVWVLPCHPTLACPTPGESCGQAALLNRLSFPLRGSVIPVAFVEKPSGPVADRGWTLHRQLRLSALQGRETGLLGRKQTLAEIGKKLQDPAGL